MPIMIIGTEISCEETWQSIKNAREKLEGAIYNPTGHIGLINMLVLHVSTMGRGCVRSCCCCCEAIAWQSKALVLGRGRGHSCCCEAGA